MRFIPLFDSDKTPIHYDLDLKDKKLLYDISKNARLPASFLAKHIGLSKDSILYRIKRFEERKIINSTRIIIDASLLGYDNFHIFASLNNPSQSVESRILKEISQHSNVRVILKFHGSYDFEIGFIAKGINECDKVVQDLTGIMGSNLRYYDLFAITKTFKAGAFPNSFTSGINIKKEFVSQKEGKFKIEKKDLQIVHSMRDDVRKPLVEVATKLRISPDSVAYRLKNMENSKFILAYSPVVNYSALGYRIHAIVFSMKQFDENREKHVKSFLENNPHVLWAVKTLGRYNVLLYICTKTEEEYHGFLAELRNTFPEQLLRYDSLHAFAEYKYEYVPDCLFKEL